MKTCFKRSAKRSIIILALTIASLTTVLCQNLTLTGTIRDNANNDPVIGAYVIVRNSADTADVKGTVTDVNGRFSIPGLLAGSYQFIVKSINYQNQLKEIKLSRSTADLGIIYLEVESRSFKEVVVTGHGTVVQKGDTTTMLADAFKVNVDATAEDLVKKMPGITVDNGTIKARGEEVKQVLVDGKTFFGDDPTVALKNLPADVIDRVQVYNKLSDQAELTGFDDGQSTRTINLITRKESKISS
ncbi:MAG: carboxypeptidase regulatory-like domain-containing protein, partial [Bacteroidales bacterium]|nr:carboxypeptidase regulatory-like domain-containing protein [Bacteroidales bacterium]